MSALIKPGVSPAYVSHGWRRWVAMCGHPERCTFAAQLEPFTDGFICPECGGVTDVVWPSAAMVEGVQRLLSMRPHPRNQSWYPGETLIDLLTENALHGVFDQAPAALPGTTLLQVEEARIVTDALPALPGRPAVDA